MGNESEGVRASVKGLVGELGGSATVEDRGGLHYQDVSGHEEMNDVMVW